MPSHIQKPAEIKAHGSIPKIIREYAGLVNTKTSEVSIAHMQSPAGWTEPGQTPEFDEYTVVLKGELRVAHKGGEIRVKAGEAVLAKAGEWVRYSTPGGDTEYIAVCIPAFSPASVHRDPE